MSGREVLQDMQFIAPMLVIVGLALVLMILDAFSSKPLKAAAGAGEVAPPQPQSRAFLGWIALLGIAVALAITFAFWGDKGKTVGRALFGGMLVVDNYSLFFNVIFLAGAALTILYSLHYLRDQGLEHGEYYVLILFAVSGMMVIASASDLLTLFLGIETMSICTYVLVGFRRQGDRSPEGAMKYFLLGAFSTGILLYGIALIYGATGHTGFQDIARAVAAKSSLLSDPYLLVGVGLLVVALGFKIASVPFHMWAPDAYEGAPTAVTGFMACAVKAAAFAGLTRIFTTMLSQKGLAIGPHGWFLVLAVLAVLTMTVGNLVAIAQKSIKRMLAYSSIAHAGYLLVGILALPFVGKGATTSILFYLFAYSFTVLGAFGVILMLERKGREDPLRLDDFSGLGYRYPLAGLAMAIFMLSLAGVPPTGGFFAKFYLFRSAVQAGGPQNTLMYTIVALALLNSAAAAYYYLRVVVYMYFREPDREQSLMRSTPAVIALIVALGLVLVMGLMPDPYLDLGAKATSSLDLFGKW